MNAQVPAAGGCPSAAARSTKRSSSSSSDLPDVNRLRLLFFPLECHGRDRGTPSSKGNSLSACFADGRPEALAAWACCPLSTETLRARVFSLDEFGRTLRQLVVYVPPSGTTPSRSSGSIRDCSSHSSSISSYSLAAASEQQRRLSRRSFCLLCHSMKVGVPVPSRPASPLGGGALRRPVVRCREPP